MTHRQQPGTAVRGVPVPRRTVLLAAAAAAAAIAPAGCGRSTSVPPLLTADVRRAQPSADAPVAELGDAMTGFAQRLLRVSPGAQDNWIASPLSIAVAFAMARAGAAGNTAAQLDHVFGFPARGVHDGFNAITRELTATDQPPGKLAEWEPGEPPPKPVVSRWTPSTRRPSPRSGAP